MQEVEMHIETKLKGLYTFIYILNQQDREEGGVSIDLYDHILDGVQSHHISLSFFGLKKE